VTEVDGENKKRIFWGINSDKIFMT